MRGRKPTPTALKLVRGNPGKRPLNKGEPPSAPALPDCPEFLGEIARAHWVRLGTQMLRAGIVTRLDEDAFAAYCAAYEAMVIAQSEIKKERDDGGAGYLTMTEGGSVTRSPWVVMAERAFSQMRQLWPEFGLTPSARARMSISPDENTKEQLEKALSA